MSTLKEKIIKYRMSLTLAMGGGGFIVSSRCSIPRAEPYSSVGSVAYLRTGGRWFVPRLDQHSFRGLMISIETGFILLSPLSVVSTMVMWKSSQWLGKNILRRTG